MVIVLFALLLLDASPEVITAVHKTAAEYCLELGGRGVAEHGVFTWSYRCVRPEKEKMS